MDNNSNFPWSVLIPGLISISHKLSLNRIENTGKMATGPYIIGPISTTFRPNFIEVVLIGPPIAPVLQKIIVKSSQSGPKVRIRKYVGSVRSIFRFYHQYIRTSTPFNILYKYDSYIWRYSYIICLEMYTIPFIFKYRSWIFINFFFCKNNKNKIKKLLHTYFKLCKMTLFTIVRIYFLLHMEIFSKMKRIHILEVFFKTFRKKNFVHIKYKINKI